MGRGLCPFRPRERNPSPVAELFIEYFSQGRDEFVEDVEAVLRSSKATHLAYVIVSQILPRWPPEALRRIEYELLKRATDSSFPEIALMSIRLLAENEFSDTEGLRRWLTFIEERLARNLAVARRLKERYFCESI